MLRVKNWLRGLWYDFEYLGMAALAGLEEIGLL